MRAAGYTLLAIAVLAVVGAPFVSPHDVDAAWPGLLNAPPTVPHVRGEDGTWRAPFIYQWRLVNQLEQQYQEDRSEPVPVVWFSGGRLVASRDDARAPLLLLGADSYGRDVFGRLVHGARISLGLSAVAALGAMVLGALV